MARYFTKDLFDYLGDLKDNNNRQWFNDNKTRYESTVREPALRFIDDFREPLRSLSPHFEASAKMVGGSLFRIHNDVRFSKDKTPYKTHVGIHFRHERAKDAHAPGFYLHLEPRNCFTGIGLWRPETPVAYTIRQFIADHADRWTDIIHEPAFEESFTLDGDSLKRPPKGFAADHPLVADLKRKDFIAITKLTQKEITGPSFLDRFNDRLEVTVPFMRFLCDSLDVPS